MCMIHMYIALYLHEMTWYLQLESCYTYTILLPCVTTKELSAAVIMVSS